MPFGNEVGAFIATSVSRSDSRVKKPMTGPDSTASGRIVSWPLQRSLVG